MAKELKTRLQLKYDTYANWTNEDAEGKGANLVLLKGEIGLCELSTGNAEATTAPTVLFKVGDGTTPFKGLQWASALAADVHTWAKKSEDDFKDWLDRTAKFATDAEVEEIRSGLDSRLVAIEAQFGENGTTKKAIDDINAALDVINGDATVEGSIAKAKADAIAAADTDATTKANAAKEAAIAEATKLDGIMDGRVGTLEAAKTEHAGLISDNKKAIEKEVTDRKAAIKDVTDAYIAADKVITDSIGAVAEGKTVVEMISDAIDTAATTAQGKVNTLANGAVATNASNIAKNIADIEQLVEDLADEVSARKNADDEINERLVEVEAFFATAEGETLDNALDTLKEIQDYLNGEGTATDGIIGKIAALEGRATKAEGNIAQNAADITAVEGEVDTLQDITAGYEGTTIKAAVDKAQLDATQGINDAKAAQDAADKAQKEIDALELVVGDKDNGLVKLVNTVKATADGAAADTANLKPKMETAESNITALQNIVVNGDNTNAKLRTDITALQDIVVNGANANSKLRTDLTTVSDNLATLTGVVNNTSTGLAATKAIADGAVSRVAAIEGDYLKEADEFIINCGSSTTMLHTK